MVVVLTVSPVSAYFPTTFDFTPDNRPWCGQEILSQITGVSLPHVLWEVGFGRTTSYDLIVFLKKHGYENATRGIGTNDNAEIVLRYSGYSLHWAYGTPPSDPMYGYYTVDTVQWIKL